MTDPFKGWKESLQAPTPNSFNSKQNFEPSKKIWKIHPVGALKVNASLEDGVRKYEVLLADLKDRRDDLLARHGTRGVALPKNTGDGP